MARLAAVAAVGVALALVTAGAASARTGRAPEGVAARAQCPGKNVHPGLPRAFADRRTLVVGPLVMEGVHERRRFEAYDPASGGQKFPIWIRGGHRVTVEADARVPGAGLSYVGQEGGGPSRIVSFVACTRTVTYFHGGVVADGPSCVPLRLWVDDEPTPRRVVLRLGVPACPAR